MILSGRNASRLYCMTTGTLICLRLSMCETHFEKIWRNGGKKGKKSQRNKNIIDG